MNQKITSLRYFEKGFLISSKKTIIFIVWKSISSIVYDNDTNVISIHFTHKNEVLNQTGSTELLFLDLIKEYNVKSMNNDDYFKS
jgi:hypothetical protein